MKSAQARAYERQKETSCFKKGGGGGGGGEGEKEKHSLPTPEDKTDQGDKRRDEIEPPSSSGQLEHEEKDFAFLTKNAKKRSQEKRGRAEVH